MFSSTWSFKKAESREKDLPPEPDSDEENIQIVIMTVIHKMTIWGKLGSWTSASTCHRPQVNSTVNYEANLNIRDYFCLLMDFHENGCASRWVVFLKTVNVNFDLGAYLYIIFHIHNFAWDFTSLVKSQAKLWIWNVIYKYASISKLTFTVLRNTTHLLAHPFSWKSNNRQK